MEYQEENGELRESGKNLREKRLMPDHDLSGIQSTNNSLSAFVKGQVEIKSDKRPGRNQYCVRDQIVCPWVMINDSPTLATDSMLLEVIDVVTKVKK